MLQGLTAHALSQDAYPLRAGEVALIHGVAGGVDGLLAQMAKRRGARVLGTISSADKMGRAREVGADEVIVRSNEDFADAAKRLTGGRGVDVVYDGVGTDTFERGLVAALRPKGYMILYGESSGPVPTLDTHHLRQHGGRYFTRVTVSNYVGTRDELLRRANELFDWIRTGALEVRLERTYPLADAARAHEDLMSRTRTGKLVLDVAS